MGKKEANKAAFLTKDEKNPHLNRQRTGQIKAESSVPVDKIRTETSLFGASHETAS